MQPLKCIYQDGILKIVSAAIPSDNVLGELTQLVTLGLISNTGYAAGASITGVAATIQNAVSQSFNLFRFLPHKCLSRS